MAGFLAVEAFAGAGVLNVGFLRFCPEICLSGHDPIAVISARK
jgi:hypothetical protein